jgi:hypothetical protein
VRATVYDGGEINRVGYDRTSKEWVAMIVGLFEFCKMCEGRGKGGG